MPLLTVVRLLLCSCLCFCVSFSHHNKWATLVLISCFSCNLQTPSCSDIIPQLWCCCSTNVKEVLENDPGAYFVHDELLAPLKVMYNSLQETGDDSIANGRLLDAMRQVSSLCLHALFCMPPSSVPCQLPWWDVDIQPYVHLKLSMTRLTAGAMFWAGDGEAGHQAGVHSPQRCH